MTRRLHGATGLLVFSLGAACAPPPPKAAPAPVPTDLVVLLPDPESGRLGRATVTGTTGGAVDLTAAGEGTRVDAQGPSAPSVIPADDVQRIFGAAIAARPPEPRAFVLYFESGSDTLTRESQALVPEILSVVRDRPAPDVTVIGHTDTTGDAASNVQLGLRRATLIRDLLVSSGLDPAQVDVASHGESNLLVPTPDATDEPRNRRVEVTIR